MAGDLYSRFSRPWFRCVCDTDLFLRFLESSEGHVQILVDVFFSEKLHGSFVDLPAVSDVAVFLLKPSVFDPVLHLRVDHDEFRAVKDITTDADEQKLQQTWRDSFTVCRGR